jgi:hypothetical protein
MSWDYRIIEITGSDGEPYYEIHDVYYKRTGTVKMWSADAISPGGCTPDELKWDLENMLEATKRPILKLKETRRGREYLEEVMPSERKA